MMFSRNKEKKMKNICIFLLIFYTSSLLAELPPYVYDQLKHSATEDVVIEVKKVRTSFFAIHDQDVNIEARVVTVRHSERGLKVGDTIAVFYIHEIRQAGMVGPSTLPVLHENKIYHAYLTFDDVGKKYIPAARGQSFEPLE